MSIGRTAHAKGFTLLEVLVAIAILGVIMVLVQTTTSQMLDAKDRVENRDMLLQSGRVALRKLTDDLTVAFLTRKNPAAAALAASTPQGQTPQIATSSIVRTIPRPITFFIGEDHGDRDSLHFTTLSHMRLVKNAKESDQAKVKYEVVASPDDPRIFNLVRTEVPWLDDRTDVEGKAVPLAEGVAKFNVEYYDARKDEWVREWNTEQLDWQDRLPLAVRASIIFTDPENEEEMVEMTTGVFLSLSAGPIDSY